jgi:hypothetical protein
MRSTPQATAIPLEEDEILFLERRFERVRKEYMYGMKLLMWICVLLPVVSALLSLLNDTVYIPLPVIYGYGQLITAIAFILIMGANYYRGLYQIKKDLHYRIKLAFPVEILRKRYVAQNNTHHFFISVGLKYSIEVDQNYFDQYQEGDEVMIEFTRYSKIFLGYY